MALQTRVGGRGGVERVTLLNARFQQTPFRSAPTCLGTNYLASVWDNFPSIYSKRVNTHVSGCGFPTGDGRGGNDRPVRPLTTIFAKRAPGWCYRQAGRRARGGVNCYLAHGAVWWRVWVFVRNEKKASRTTTERTAASAAGMILSILSFGRQRGAQLCTAEKSDDLPSANK